MQVSIASILFDVPLLLTLRDYVAFAVPFLLDIIALVVYHITAALWLHTLVVVEDDAVSVAVELGIVVLV